MPFLRVSWLSHPWRLALAMTGLAACAVHPPSPPAPSHGPGGPVAAVDLTVIPPPSHPVDPSMTAVLAAWHATHPGSTAEPVVVGPLVPWPGAPDGTPRVLAAVNTGATDPRGALVMTAVPWVQDHADTASPTVTAGEYYPAATGVAVRDVNHDGRPDAVCFLSVGPDGAAPAGTVMVYTTAPDSPWGLIPLTAVQSRLQGVRDEASLDAALPTVDRFEAPTAATDPVRFIARLESITADALRGVIPPTGLRMCSEVRLVSGQTRRHCSTVMPAQVNQAAVQRLHHTLAPIAPMGDGDFAQGTVDAPRCERTDTNVTCSATSGAPWGNRWVLTGEGTSLRLVEATGWSINLPEPHPRS